MNPAQTPPTAAAESAHICAILLAAGFGRRFDKSGQSNKLLAPFLDGTVVQATAKAILASGLPIVAVVRPQPIQLHHELQALGCTVVVSEKAADGMGFSIADALHYVQRLLAQTGAAAHPRTAPDPDGVLICLADMPFIKPEIYRAVCSSLSATQTTTAAAYNGQRGHPVAFWSNHFDALSKLSGDTGAGKLLHAYPPQLIETNDPTVLQDIDQPIDLPATNRLIGR